MAAPGSAEPFSLLGGPLHKLSRLGLVRSETNTVLLGIALGWGGWLLMVGVALVEGVADRLFSMSVVGGTLDWCS